MMIGGHMNNKVFDLSVHLSQRSPPPCHIPEFPPYLVDGYVGMELAGRVLVCGGNSELDPNVASDACWKYEPRNVQIPNWQAGIFMVRKR